MYTTLLILVILELMLFVVFMITNVVRAKNYKKFRRYLQDNGSDVLGKSVTESPLLDPFYAPVRISIYTLTRAYKKESNPELKAMALRHSKDTLLFFMQLFAIVAVGVITVVLAKHMKG